MSTIVYTLASHKFRVLPAQIKLLKEHVDELSRIIVVQGPFGKTGNSDAGSRYLPSDKAEKLGVEILDLGDVGGGWPAHLRVPVIADWVRHHSFSQRERFAMLMHSDTLPTKKVNVPAILDGFAFAGRGRRRKDRTLMFETWQAWDSEEPGMQAVTVYHHQPSGPVGIKIYDAVVLPEHMYFEKCEPCFLHLNQLMGIPEEMLAAKINKAAEFLGCELPNYDPSEELDDELPYFKMRGHFPTEHTAVRPAIPEGHMPKAEMTVERARTYISSLQRWFSSGSKVRPAEEVEAIRLRHCHTCDWLNKERATCSHPQCGLIGDERGLQHLLPAVSNQPIANKIAIATENCPIWHW